MGRGITHCWQKIAIYNTKLRIKQTLSENFDIQGRVGGAITYFRAQHPEWRVAPRGVREIVSNIPRVRCSRYFHEKKSQHPDGLRLSPKELRVVCVQHSGEANFWGL